MMIINRLSSLFFGRRCAAPARGVVVPVLLGCAVSCFWGVAQAADKILIQDWVVQTTDNSAEAYTVSGSDTSFGMYCVDGAQCVFYIHTPLNCRTGAQTMVLMNTGDTSTALSMRCTQIGNHVFQLLDPFNTVYEALQKSRFVSLALPIDSGGFALSRFTTEGAKKAVQYVVEDAAKTAKNRRRPETPFVPGARRIEEISL